MAWAEFLQFAEKVVELTGSGSRIVFKELPQDDPKVRQPDITKARETLGWEPRYADLDFIVKTALDWERALPARIKRGAA